MYSSDARVRLSSTHFAATRRTVTHIHAIDVVESEFVGERVLHVQSHSIRKGKNRRPRSLHINGRQNENVIGQRIQTQRADPEI